MQHRKMTLEELLNHEEKFIRIMARSIDEAFIERNQIKEKEDRIKKVFSKEEDKN